MLRLSLRSGEALVINGALIRARGRCELTIENHAALLRGREIMALDEANSPARRLYYATMMAYLGEESDRHREQIVDELRTVMDTMPDETGKATCVRYARLIAERDDYRALSVCRQLIDAEAA